MAGSPRVKNPKPGNSNPEQRKKSIQKIVFNIFAIIIIISWIVSLLVNI